MLKYPVLAGFLLLFTSNLSYPQMSRLDSGYYYLNQGNRKKAIEIFENHLKENPKDNKIHLQLGYIYYSQNKLDKSLKHFQYVGKHSMDDADLESSRSAVVVIKDELALKAKTALDIYFYNFYDSYQENYIANFIGHYNFRIAPQFYTGLYVDLYTDSRSKPELIYNDRFVEVGGFLRYNLLKNLFIEFRIGYANEIDLDKSSINFKPMIVYFTRIGEGRIYVGRKSSSKVSPFIDLYYAAMYDYKFKNTFLQAAFQEVLRYHTGGYSHMDSYLVQYGQFDNRKLDYNNYAEFGTGLRFHPNLMYFPSLFVEPTYKVYFYGQMKNSFQIKAGFQFIFKTPL